jgi:methylmalonyl-CoA/ethylmalonyl-CoA epimerase
MSGTFTFHHIGVAVADLEQAAAFYTTALGFHVVSGPIEDPIQKVKACFLAEAGRSQIHIELISPTGSDSPVNAYLTKGIGAYHVCYEVTDISSALTELRSKGCLVICKPVTAVAYAGRKIAWCFTPTNQLVELLERQTSSPN